MNGDTVSITNTVSIIQQIANAAGVTNERVHIVPGEHDADAPNPERSRQINEAWEDYKNKKRHTQTFSNMIPLVNQFSKPFHTLCNKFYGITDNPWNKKFGPHFFHKIDDDIAFIYLNSSLFATNFNAAANRPYDLFLGKYYIEKMLKKTMMAHTIIFISHHPLEMIAPEDKNWLSKEIIHRNRDWLDGKIKHRRRYGWFCGHEHTPDHRLDGADIFVAASLTGYGSHIPQFSQYSIPPDIPLNRIIPQHFRYTIHNGQPQWF